MAISRAQFIASTCGLVAGLPLGYAARASQRADVPPPEPATPPPAPKTESGERSYAQAGEDVCTEFTFRYLNITDRTYFDIGAYDPVEINNTYFFYLKGWRGVLVEPNVTMADKCREVRPEDKTITAGIGITAQREADYYLMTAPAWNTFSKTEAEHQQKATEGRVKIERVIKMPLLDVNDVMAEHFGRKAPAFLSIDAEGLHLDILKAVDYSRFRPRVICAETLVSGARTYMPEVAAFMASRNYVARGGSFVNTLFVDRGLI